MAIIIILVVEKLLFWLLKKIRIYLKSFTTNTISLDDTMFYPISGETQNDCSR